jgi:ATP-dependent helicase/nuclease subunit A
VSEPRLPVGRRLPVEPRLPVDHDIRRRVGNDLHTTFLVEAGAGTGKTRVLVDRYVSCLTGDDAAPIGAVVAITFTEKAAGELRQRVRGRLERLLEGHAVLGDGRGPSSEDLGLLSDALKGLDDAPISTIHAFAARLLRERPVEAGVDPVFVQLDQVASELWRERLWRDWLSGLLDNGRAAAGGDDAESASGGDAASGPDGEGNGPADLLAEILRTGVTIEQVAELARARFAERFSVDDTPLPVPPDLASAIAAVKIGAANVSVATRACTADDDKLKSGSLGLAGAAAALPDAGDLHELGRAVLTASSRAVSFCGKNAGKAPNWPGGKGGKEAMLGVRDALRAQLDEAADAYGAYVAGLALAVAADFVRTAAAAQLDAGALDFDDLLGRARELLAGAPGSDPDHVAAVRGHFQRRYHYLLVDEFQDTDPLQAEIAFLLAEREPTARGWRDVELRPGKLFLVGDPKQSIYRFRRADIAMYDEVKELVRRQGGEVVPLLQNFRTVLSVVGWVNAVFDGLLGSVAAPGLQPAYHALTPFRADGRPGRDVVVVRGADDGDAAAGAPAEGPAELCRREAGLIAGLLTDMERLGWRVHTSDDATGAQIGAAGDDAAPAPADAAGADDDSGADSDAGDTSWRPALPGDVAILLPSFTHVGHYEQALRAAGLPYRVEGGRTFFGRREVLDCLAVLRAIDTAADPVAVYAALHSQLFAFSDDDLYAFHAAGGAFDYLGAAPPVGFPEIAAALADLRALHERRNLRPPAETLDELVRRTRLFESLALWADDAEQAIGNVAELVSLADEFAHSAEATFHAFVAKMARDVGAADTAESPVGEVGDFVRLTTVHKAKGLEFPVVVLASAMLAPRAAKRAPLVDRAARRLDCSLECPTPDFDKPGAAVKFQSAGYESRFDHEKLALDAERSRVLYVALTRAADLLVLPIVADEPPTGSLQARWQGVVPFGAQAEDEGDGVGAQDERDGGTASDGGDGDAASDGEDSFAAEGDGHGDGGSDFVRIETWGGGGGGGGGGAAQSAPPPPPTADSLAARETWRAERAELLARASRAAPVFAPSALERLEPPDWSDVSVLTPTDLAKAQPMSPSPPSATGAAVDERRPAGREHALALGTAVHAALEQVSLDDDSGLAGLAETAAARAGLAGEAGRVADLVRACWRTAPLRAAARRPHYRELPVCVRHGEVVIEGAIDLVYHDDELGGWIVVDYKTDAHLQPDEVRQRYGGQAGAYALAFEAAAGERVVAVEVLLASLTDSAGAATVVRLTCDQTLRDLVESRLREAIA